MKTPKELQGKEVQKFEDLALNCAIDNRIVPITLGGVIANYHHLYTQLFKPEMIEYFSEWIATEDEDKNLGKSTNINISDSIDEVELNFESSFYQFMPIRTLSDFIDACLNSDIKLRWK